MRVAGTDPGTSSLDVVILNDGQLTAERRWRPSEVREDATSVVRFLESHGPLDLVAAPSGYGLPLTRVQDLSPREESLITLVRSDDRDRARGVVGLTRVLKALNASELPAVVLPGGIHLPTIPAHRKSNRIDMGTPDKICVAALALHQLSERAGVALDAMNLLVVEIGSAFSAMLVLQAGKIVDARAGSFGPVGLAAAGRLDGEFAYLANPLSKDDLFDGGTGPTPSGPAAERLRESLLQTAAELTAVTPVETIALQAHGITDVSLHREIAQDLGRFGQVLGLSPLPGSSMKRAAQGAAVLADGLAGGRSSDLVAHLELRGASGTCLDYVTHPAAERIRNAIS